MSPVKMSPVVKIKDLKIQRVAKIHGTCTRTWR